MVVLQDVTAEKKAEQMRADFVANVSHELRSPLSALVGFIETLQGPAQGDKEAQEKFIKEQQEKAQFNPITTMPAAAVMPSGVCGKKTTDDGEKLSSETIENNTDCDQEMKEEDLSSSDMGGRKRKLGEIGEVASK